MEELKLKLTELKTLLMDRGNNAYTFFEKILKQIDDNNNEFFDLIIGATKIIQYGDFTLKEENLFIEIWDLADNLKDSINESS